jgi:hypothetical protein
VTLINRNLLPILAAIAFQQRTTLPLSVCIEFILIEIERCAHPLEELSKLKELQHDEGAISDTEYDAAKDRLLTKSNALASPDHPNTKDLFGSNFQLHARPVDLELVTSTFDSELEVPLLD